MKQDPELIIRDINLSENRSDSAKATSDLGKLSAIVSIAPNPYFQLKKWAKNRAPLAPISAPIAEYKPQISPSFITGELPFLPSMFDYSTKSKAKIKSISTPIKNSIEIEKNKLASAKNYSKIVELKNISLNKRIMELESSLLAAGELLDRLMNFEERELSVETSFHKKPKNFSGGDYAMIKNTANGAIIIVADAAGHDIASSFYAFLADAVFERVFCEELTGDTYLKELNKTIIEKFGYDRTISATFIKLDYNRSIAEMCVAGHTPTIYFSKHLDKCKSYRTRGALLGISKDFEVNTIKIPIFTEDVFCVYTDGLTNAYAYDKAGRRNFISDEIIEDCVRNLNDLNFKDSANFIWNSIIKEGKNIIMDDAMLLCLKIPVH
jgi:serine phosphatase RsbU (regulator of sigma subunit)